MTLCFIQDCTYFLRLCFRLLVLVMFYVQIWTLCTIFVQVIYGLNTKNDEHEAVAARAELLHEEQLNMVREEMQTKIECYR